MALYPLPRELHPDFANPRIKPVGNVALRTSNQVAGKLLDSWDIINGWEINLARNNPIVTTSAAVYSYEKGQRGFNLANVSTQTPVAVGHNLSRFSHEVLFVVDTATSQSISIMAEIPGASTKDRSIEIASDGTFKFSIFDGATKNVFSTTTAVSGETYHVVCTATGSSGTGKMHIYVNGVLEGTADAGDAFVFASPELVLGYGSTLSSGAQSDAYVLYHRVYKDLLSDIEVASLAKDHYQILKPVIQPTYFTAAAAVIGFVGYNFRATLAYVTDGSGEVDVLGGSDLYPQSGTVDFGWIDVSGDPRRDRDSGIDARLAGINFQSNNGTQRLFVANTGNGTFDITLALGDAGGTQTIWAEICDVNTSNVVQSVLDTVLAGTTVSSDHWVDATGTDRTSASDWVSNNATLQVTVVSGRLGIRIGPTTNEGGSSTLSHFGYEAVAAPPTGDAINDTYYKFLLAGGQL